MVNTHNTISIQNQKSGYKAHNLPHYFDSEKPVFITYRLKFTLPGRIMDRFAKRKQEWLDDQANASPQDKQNTHNKKDGLHFAWFDELLGKADDIPQVLHEKDITDIIASSFQHFNELRYKLLAYCIMPNHVHVLFLPINCADGSVFPVSRIIYSWKRYSANQINRILKRKGALWQQESYDHVVRNEAEMMNVVNYIIQNPVKAGLVDSWQQWPGTWIHDFVAGGCRSSAEGGK